MSAGTDEPDDTRPADDGASSADDHPTRTATSEASDARDDLPELAPHLKHRYDRPREAGEIAQGRSQARLILVLLFAALPFVVLVVVVLNSLASGPPDRTVQGQQGSLNEVTRYCNYTIQAGQDWDDCLKRTDFRVLQKQQTNGARYARGELTRCLPDSGPRCTLR